jgi:acyl dehydratase
MEDGLITAEALDELRKRVGIKLRISPERIGNEFVTKEAIKYFANGVGDPNPLWRDEEYAKKTYYGGIVAPPSWFYSVGGSVQHGLRGVHGFHAGDQWEFFKPLFVGDRIRVESMFSGFDEKTSSFARKMVIQYDEVSYYNQRDELIAKVNGSVIRVERKASREQQKYSRMQLPHPWTEEELKKIEEEVLAEQIRGSEARYWEDVEVGQELPPVVKGPLGLTDVIAFIAGCRRTLVAHGVALRQYRRHPAWAFRDPNTYALEPIGAVHWNKWAANRAGLPFPYDSGAQRNTWLIELLTDWIGDDGWLKKCCAEYRGFVFHSDVVWLKGKVTSKYVDDNGEHCVDIETSAINQREENTMPGTATVILPSKEKCNWPVRNRLSS